jgi:hypothetical protein
MDVDPPKAKQSRKRYVPSDEDRQLVCVLVGLNRRHEDIAASIKNPATGKHINIKTLTRHYRRELQSQRALSELGVDAWNSLGRLVKEGHWNATQFALNLMGLTPDATAAGQVTISANDARMGGIKVEFVPSRHANEPMPEPPLDYLDITRLKTIEGPSARMPAPFADSPVPSIPQVAAGPSPRRSHQRARQSP